MESLTSLEGVTIGIVAILVIALLLLLYILYSVYTAPRYDSEEFTLIVAEVYAFKVGDAIEIANEDAPNGKSRCVITDIDENKGMITLKEL
jgi:hypothetical protein